MLNSNFHPLTPVEGSGGQITKFEGGKIVFCQTEACRTCNLTFGSSFVFVFFMLLSFFWNTFTFCFFNCSFSRYFFLFKLKRWRTWPQIGFHLVELFPSVKLQPNTPLSFISSCLFSCFNLSSNVVHLTVGVVNNVGKPWERVAYLMRNRARAQKIFFSLEKKRENTEPHNWLVI